MPNFRAVKISPNPTLGQPERVLLKNIVNKEAKNRRIRFNTSEGQVQTVEPQGCGFNSKGFS
jgi:hypothetical protein